ncbi:hypothetical protein ABMA59_30855 [Mesorhizobium sp. CN2-181]
MVKFTERATGLRVDADRGDRIAVTAYKYLRYAKKTFAYAGVKFAAIEIGTVQQIVLSCNCNNCSKER